MGKKVLVCDDSILARKKLKNLLVESGIEDVVEAADGQQAVDKYKEIKPDFVFMDIVMPVKDGVDAVKEIVEFDANAFVVMVSSVGTKEYLHNAIKNGAKDFIQKPIEDSRFKELISKLV